MGCSTGGHGRRLPPPSAAVGFELRTEGTLQAAVGTQPWAGVWGRCCLILGVWLVLSWDGVGSVLIISRHALTQMSSALPDSGGNLTGVARAWNGDVSV